MYNLTVILRTCDRVEAFSGNRPRDFGTKKEVMIKCITSLEKSISYFKSEGHSCKFLIVDDHSSNETINFLKSLNADNIESLKESGNGASFGRCVDLAIKENDLVFLVEDDYLLREECLLSMVSTYWKFRFDHQTEFCFHPVDYPDRYLKPEASMILLGQGRHYRTIRHTTCTFMYHSNIFRKCEKELKKFCDYGIIPGVTEDTSINLIYDRYPCVSPIPSLAEHYQYFSTLSPYYSKLIYEK